MSINRLLFVAIVAVLLWSLIDKAVRMDCERRPMLPACEPYNGGK